MGVFIRMLDFKDIPWQDIVIETRDYIVFRDKYPVTEGHLLFVPRKTEWQSLVKCWEAAYKWGYDWVEREYCDSFNIGQNCGKEAGQSIDYPHVHLIPRRHGDMTDPKGGVRGVIPEKQKY